ncbi:DNA topoisomerase 2-associated protein PAT1 [Candida viswanathii]|uniref:DNA topoisomerase 2-associated protein PAT1 n=1 Tax=Candida viswanathii TaxID=5486 RepID=A0A367XQE6_9ASCO|nr:DNA topoisomerase 2-associated protein PAT1 [Candida viswanathii]
MSFFGFDPTAPPQGGQKKDEVYDFENTYDGLGELEEDDVLNSETFGTSTQEIRKDFDFGHGGSKEPTPQASAPIPAQASVPQGISYAQAAAQPANDDEFMEDLWGSSNAPGKQQQQQAQQDAASGKTEKKFFNNQFPPQQQQQQQFPPQPYGIPGMMPPPPQFGYMMPPGYFPQQYGYPGMMPQQMPPMPPQQQQQQQQQVPPPQQQQQQQPQQQVPAQQPQQAPQAEQAKGSPAPVQNTRRAQKVDLSQFPVWNHEVLWYYESKDKDFVTRFQLSQIVTEDPYNEDFYAQVYKVIHPKTTNGVQQQHQHENNSIAQAYLDHSGHRLGGRYKRADVALQRMQQQVQKAVAVAKERPKLTQYAKEGALGKISVGGGKNPRQQLVIVSKAAEREQQLQEQKAERKEGTKSYSKKDILSILESIICELMNVESESRTKQDVDTTKLWDSLKVLEQPSSSGDEENEVNPFIQCLNYNKMLKILPRLFKFLNREQVLTIVTLIMSNLENLSVIKNGSYTTYPDKKLPEKILKLVDSYSLTFSKILMNAVLEFKFNEIIGLLVILIEHNNVSFVSTTKIGLSILTTLLSRAELIIGEGTISATDLSEWSSCYDELFTSLESRIQAIFPPNFDELDDGSSRENYIWQFLATLSLGGKLSHQRIIVDEVRDEIFGVMNRAKKIDNSDYNNLYKKQNLLNNLNMYLVVMGLVADENDIKELQQ